MLPRCARQKSHEDIVAALARRKIFARGGTEQQQILYEVASAKFLQFSSAPLKLLSHEICFSFTDQAFDMPMQLFHSVQHGVPV